MTEPDAASTRDRDPRAGLRTGNVSWYESDRVLPRRFIRPFLRFMRSDPAPATAMTAAAVVAFVWANSPWHGSYAALWSTPVVVALGTHFSFDLTLQATVNDAAMTLFFLLVGIELKTEAVQGHLRHLRAALLPVSAALGGMIVPAVLYLAVNAGTPGVRGWGIPMATDIAFAVGVISLLGSRISKGARVFLLTLAIVDDIGSILVISAFYAHHLKLTWLVVGLLALGAVLVLRRADVQSLVPYTAIGIIAWFGLYEAGVEPAIVGAAFGLLTPLKALHPSDSLTGTVTTFAKRADRALQSGPERAGDAAAALIGLDTFVTQATPPAWRIQHRLVLWVNLAVLPLFALANAGVRLAGVRLDVRIFFGTLLGLVLGKVVGVTVFSGAGSRFFHHPLPGRMSGVELATVGTTAGIGFSVALFIATLAFDSPDLAASARLGVLAATVLAGGLSLAVGVAVDRASRRSTR